MRKTVIIACSIFKHELDKIHRKHENYPDIIYLDSMLHMKPEKLDNSLTKLLQVHNESNIILLYGDCSPGIIALENRNNIYRIPGINCINITLGDIQYKKLRKEGAFILMNEWMQRWKEVFQVELGFKTQENATAFMREMHTKLVFLDTGAQPIPTSKLKEISEYVGLPYKIEKSTPNNLEEEINKAINYFSHAN